MEIEVRWRDGKTTSFVNVVRMKRRKVGYGDVLELFHSDVATPTLVDLDETTYVADSTVILRELTTE